MRFTSCIPALDMLTIQLDPLSKPVGPIYFKELFDSAGIPYETRSRNRGANLRNFCYICNPFNIIKKHTKPKFYGSNLCSYQRTQKSAR